MKLLILIFNLIIFNSCNNTINIDQCELWFMDAYKGHPPSAHKYKKNCLGKKHLEARFSCQKALEKLILGSNEKDLKKTFGPKVMGCFTEKELRKFSK